MEYFKSHLLTRIHSKIIEDGDCWRWTGAVQKTGNTPTMQWMGRVGNVRRFILLESGPQRKNYLASNSCGHAWCVKPEHVISEARRKIVKKSLAAMPLSDKLMRSLRMAKTIHEGRGRSKLTIEQARQIRVDDRRRDVIAAAYGVVPQTISRIRNGKSWAEINDASVNPFAQLMR